MLPTAMLPSFANEFKYACARHAETSLVDPLVCSSSSSLEATRYRYACFVSWTRLTDYWCSEPTPSWVTYEDVAEQPKKRTYRCCPRCGDSFNSVLRLNEHKLACGGVEAAAAVARAQESAAAVLALWSDAAPSEDACATSNITADETKSWPQFRNWLIAPLGYSATGSTRCVKSDRTQVVLKEVLHSGGVYEPFHPPFRAGFDVSDASRSGGIADGLEDPLRRDDGAQHSDFGN